MKDKSRLLSSVIVSLLAGFIYYQFGEDIQQRFQNSFKAVLSSNVNNEMEQCLPHNCQPFNSLIAKSESNSNSKKSKFYIKKNFKNTVEFKKNNLTVPGEDLMSEFIAVNQARFQRPQADKRIDFTHELENLVKNNLQEIQSKDFELKLDSKKSGNEVAELKATRPHNIVVIKEFDKVKRSGRIVHTTGYGFEYNYVTEESLSKTKDNSGKTKGNSGKKKELINDNNKYEYSTESSSSSCNQKGKEHRIKVINGKKIKVVVPRENVNSETEVIEAEIPEVNIQDEDCDEGTM